MKLLIGGDFAPTKANFDLFEQGSPQALYSEELASYLARFDFRVFDFETVLEGAGTPITKHGPIITTPERCMPGIDTIHPNLFTLANNHSVNLGPEGIAHTKEVLAAHGIQSIGAGADIAEARKPYYLEVDGITIGFYTCAEHEFNAAGEHAAGVNPYDPLVTFDEVHEAKQHCDQLIVLYHGGMIEYRYPLPEERRALRKLVDCGADLVVGQHTHCIGCSEVYKGKTIVYGQGDFLFARPTKNEYRFSGLLIEVEAAKDHLDVTFNVRVKPEDTIRLATVPRYSTHSRSAVARSRTRSASSGSTKPASPSADASTSIASSANTAGRSSMRASTRSRADGTAVTSIKNAMPSSIGSTWIIGSPARRIVRS